MSSKFYDWSDKNRLPKLSSHSEAKHKVLEMFLKNYFIKILSKNLRNGIKINIIDGFSGGGVYKRAKDGELCYGSPMIFLEAVKLLEKQMRLASGKNSLIDARYYFIDKNTSALTMLEKQIKKKGYGKLLGEKIFLLGGEFSEIFPGVAEIISNKGGYNLILLDQCGYKDVPLSSIRRIFRVFGNAEVFLTFHIDTLISYLADTQEFRKCVGNFDPTGKVISTKDIKNVSKLKRSKNIFKKSAKWRLTAEMNMFKKFYKICGAKYLLPYSIISQKSNRAYWFLHLSNSAGAKNEMLKIHRKLHNYCMNYRELGLKILGFKPTDML